ncbi:hypothetical protein [Weissella paramesenteroides]|uniref:hypothetical protein n=1 Tax=Weissella paramesenteroides TaxID=1249 RepID=UPI00223BDF1B|nr:hypothetical protein [Weissella paramesenteroides]MCT0485712.1 hypothetical protein [Weissella paramesenteroides]
MTEKLVIKADNNKARGYNPVFIDAAHHEQLKQLAAATGLSMRKLAEQLLTFAIDNLEIQQSDDGELPE